MTSGARTIVIKASGRVQGVNYRGFTRDEAVRRGITGWVVNNDDGSVEAAFHGPGNALAELIERCRQGPPGAKVDGLDVRSAERGLADEAPPGAYAF